MSNGTDISAATIVKAASLHNEIHNLKLEVSAIEHEWFMSAQVLGSGRGYESQVPEAPRNARTRNLDHYSSVRNPS